MLESILENDWSRVVEQLQLTRWAIFLAVVAGFTVIGWLIEKLVFSQVTKITDKINSRSFGVVLNAFRGMLFLWIALLGVYEGLFSLPLEKSFTDHLQQLVTIVYLFSGVVVFARIFVHLVERYTARVSKVLPSTSIFTIITKIVVYILGFLMIMQTLGISITPLITALGIGGLAVSLAFQDTLANLFAGLQILVSGQISPGQYIKLDSGEEGYVVDINWRNSTIRSVLNYVIIVPNTKLASVIVNNYHQPMQPVTILFPVGVHYNSDLEHVERVTLEVMNQVLEEREEAIKTFKPFIRYHTFNDFSIDFNIHYQVREYYDRLLVNHTLVKRLNERYNQEGIVIPFPIRSLEGIPNNPPVLLQSVN